MHEVATVLQRVDLRDRLSLSPGEALAVTGFEADTLVRDALLRLAAAVGVEPTWHVQLEKQIPLAAGLGGGSADAAAALRLANETLPAPLDPAQLHELAADLGADAPFFLRDGPQLGTGTGTDLTVLDLPIDYWVVLVLPDGAAKDSTAAVYRRFDERGGERGFARRRSALHEALSSVRSAEDLALLPANDLVSSPLSERLRQEGAFRADVTGAGPTVYGLFLERDRAAAARASLDSVGRTWLVSPAW
jgi:4-diphosphocytidyl-2-C-methyl-D-erythritol kinase